MDITYKSTGALMDEYWTTSFKNNHERLQILDKTIQYRLKNNPNYAADIEWGKEQIRLYGECVMPEDCFTSRLTSLDKQLWLKLKECWDFQEIVMEYKDRDIQDLTQTDLYRLGYAAIGAQRTNAERCKLVREIDALLGESDRTYLEKTYA